MSAPAAALRRATSADTRSCFELFRSSLADLMSRLGYGGPESGPVDIDATWPAYVALFDHLAQAAGEWWIAEDPADGRALGYARSLQRGGTVELTEFFVAPDARVAGVGRALVERAFAPGVGEHRAVIATVDAPAVALYLRLGVAHETTFVDVAGAPRPVAVPDGYTVVPAQLDELLVLERELLGHAREPELAFMLADRPGVVLRRRGRSVAYAFAPNAFGHAGPVGALEPEHLPAALAHLEGAAHAAGLARLDLTLPLSARAAVDWLVVRRRFALDPFYCLFLADGPWARLDRYLPFNPCVFL